MPKIVFRDELELRRFVKYSKEIFGDENAFELESPEECRVMAKSYLNAFRNHFLVAICQDTLDEFFETEHSFIRLLIGCKESGDSLWSELPPEVTKLVESVKGSRCKGSRRKDKAIEALALMINLICEKFNEGQWREVASLSFSLPVIWDYIEMEITKKN